MSKLAKVEFVAPVLPAPTKTVETNGWVFQVDAEGHVCITGSMKKAHFSKSAVARYLKVGKDGAPAKVLPNSKAIANVIFTEGIQHVQINAYEDLVGQWQADFLKAIEAAKVEKGGLGGFI